MNKYLFLALLWFIIGIYSLIFLETDADNGVTLLPHFDKICHIGLFLIQILLIAKTFIKNNKKVPYLGLVIFALLYAFGSEWGQANFTETRQSSWLDGLADLIGTILAILIIKHQQNKKIIRN